MTKTIDLKGGTIMENREAKTNKTRGPQFSSLEEAFDHIFGDTMREAQRNHHKTQCKEVAEALWDIYVAFSEAGFSESQAMFLCSTLIDFLGR
jgi:hypothetical protein